MPQTLAPAVRTALTRNGTTRDRHHCYDPSNNLAWRRERNGKEHNGDQQSPHRIR